MFTPLKCKLPSILRARKRTIGNGTRFENVDGREATELNTNIILTEQSLPMSLEDIRVKEEKEHHEAVMRTNKRMAIRIDQVSRIVFPVAFASYTAGYWMSYNS